MILWGPTRTGKTLLSRSFGRHSYFSGLFNIDNIDDDADYAVFDDIQGGFEYFPSYKCWIGAQAEFMHRQVPPQKKHHLGQAPASGAATMTPEQLAVGRWLVGWQCGNSVHRRTNSLNLITSTLASTQCLNGQSRCRSLTQPGRKPKEIHNVQIATTRRRHSRPIIWSHIITILLLIIYDLTTNRMPPLE